MIQTDNHYQHRLKRLQRPLYTPDEMVSLFIIATWPVVTITMLVSLVNGW